MKKSSKILVSSLAVLLLGGSGVGYYLYTNNDARQSIIKLVIPKIDKKADKSDTPASSNKSESVSEAKNNDKEANGKVDSGFESSKLASNDEISEVTTYLTQLNDDMKNLSVDELNNKYFIDGRASLLKPYYNTGYSFDLNSLKVHKTKSDYLLEWGMYLKRNSLSHRVVGTYDKNMKVIRIITVE